MLDHPNPLLDQGFRQRCAERTRIEHALSRDEVGGGVLRGQGRFKRLYGRPDQRRCGNVIARFDMTALAGQGPLGLVLRKERVDEAWPGQGGGDAGCGEFVELFEGRRREFSHCSVGALEPRSGTTTPEMPHPAREVQREFRPKI